MQHNNTFDLRQLISVCILTVFLLALMLPMGEATGRGSRRSWHSSQLRGVHQGLIIYAQSNRGWYPGLDKNGNAISLETRSKTSPDNSLFPQSANYEDATVEGRYWVLLDGDFVTPEYILSPYESDPQITEWPGSGPVTTSHYSFAMLQLPETGKRRNEWRETLNSDAIVIADRNIGTPSSTYGYHNDTWTSSTTFGCTHSRRQPYINLNHWVGNVLWNDNHVAFKKSDVADTNYDGTFNQKDQLFHAVGDNDAYLIHSGN